MRVVLVFVLGLLIGAVCAAMVANTLHARHALPRGLMSLMQHQMGDLRRAIRDDRCAAEANSASLTKLRWLAGETETVLPELAQSEPGFGLRAEALRKGIDSELTQAPADCAALDASFKRVADACEACHNEYR